MQVQELGSILVIFPVESVIGPNTVLEQNNPMFSLSFNKLLLFFNLNCVSEQEYLENKPHDQTSEAMLCGGLNEDHS